VSTGGPNDETKPRRGRGVLRVLETVAVWLAVLGLFAGLGWGVFVVVRGGVERIDRQLATAQARGEVDAREVVAPGLGRLSETDRHLAGDRDPHWERQPRPQYPTSLRELVAADVELRCDVTETGALVACSIVKETPTGLGFGEAALKAAGEARLSPRLVDGVATPGQVRFAIRFRTEDPRTTQRPAEP